MSSPSIDDAVMESYLAGGSSNIFSLEVNALIQLLASACYVYVSRDQICSLAI